MKKSVAKRSAVCFKGFGMESAMTTGRCEEYIKQFF